MKGGLLPWLPRRHRDRSPGAVAYAGAAVVAPSTPWREAPCAALDFELTGLDPRRDHVISFGVVPLEHGRVLPGRALYRLVRPPVPVPATTVRIHGLRGMDLEAARPLSEHEDELLDALAGRVLIAHEAAVERAFLGPILRRHHLRARQPVIDTWVLARRLAPAGSPPRPLGELAARYGVPPASRHHALGDALTTAQLLLRLALDAERAGAGRIGDLASVR
jgi:DNA polymerase-3 subunit epsilon